LKVNGVSKGIKRCKTILSGLQRREEAMKKIRLFTMILLGFIVSGIIVWGSLRADASNQTFFFAASPNPASQPPVLSQVITESKPKFVFHFNSVNGISLYDTKESIKAKFGSPQAITQDPNLIELETYVYPMMKVGFSYGTADYVEVPAEAGSILIDDVHVATTVEAMKEALGEPDYIAEDGIVFQRRDALIKLFIDPMTRQPTVIHYYHISST
jgi:hypothetical protein